jgi:hypothetical protein
MLQGIQLSAFPDVEPYPIQNPPTLRLVPNPAPPAPLPFKVGDRVRVVRGCQQGLESTVTALRPDLKHSIVLESGKGRFPPNMLERVTVAPPAPPRFKKGDYVSPQRHHPQDIGVILSCRVWATVQWLNHTGCSREYPSSLRLRSADEPEVIAVVRQHQQERAELERWTKTLNRPPTPQSNRRYSPKGRATGWIEERQGNRKRKTPSTSYYYCWADPKGKHKLYIKASKVNRIHQMVNQRRTTQEILDFLKPNPQ